MKTVEPIHEDHIIKQTFMMNPEKPDSGVLISTADLSQIKNIKSKKSTMKYETSTFDVTEEGMMNTETNYKCDQIFKALEDHARVLKELVERGYQVKDLA